jgi:3',5'-cyclic AMP phosphodiesterase CpdA
VAVLHHHLIGAPCRAARKRPVSRRNRVLRALVDAGADLILAGHIHQAAVSERHEFEVVGDEARTAVVAVAPGFGQPRPRRLGEARGLHLHEATADALVVRTFRWSRGEWTLGAERRFPR